MTPPNLIPAVELLLCFTLGMGIMTLIFYITTAEWFPGGLLFKVLTMFVLGALVLMGLLSILPNQQQRERRYPSNEVRLLQFKVQSLFLLSKGIWEIKQV